ncbi:MAG TPA: OmpA family protein [Polyangiaceae bacterium]
MIRSSAFAISVLAAAVAFSAMGCHVQMSTKAGDTPPPAAAPAPAPAPAPEPAPAPASEPAPAPAAEAPKMADPPKPAGKVEQKGGAIKLPGNIVFDTDKATLKPGSGSDVVLDQLKQFLVENDKKIYSIRIEGHTDNQGAADHNLELSGQRALTIKKWLIDHGIDEKRLIAVGFGQDKPIAPNTTEDGKAQNRRSEFHIAETFDKNGKPVKYLGSNPLGGGKEFK